MRYLINNKIIYTLEYNNIHVLDNIIDRNNIICQLFFDISFIIFLIFSIYFINELNKREKIKKK